MKNDLLKNLYNSFSLNRKDTSPSNFSENSKNRVPVSKGLIIKVQVKHILKAAHKKCKSKKFYIPLIE